MAGQTVRGILVFLVNSEAKYLTRRVSIRSPPTDEIVVEARMCVRPEQRERREIVVEDEPTSTTSCFLSGGRVLFHEGAEVMAATAPASSRSCETLIPVSVAAFRRADR